MLTPPWMGGNFPITHMRIFNSFNSLVKGPISVRSNRLKRYSDRREEADVMWSAVPPAECRRNALLVRHRTVGAKRSKKG
jgi:hypothetical protein